MTAPGSGTATSGGTCTPATPCFVCELKAIVAEQGVSATFSDAPFAINLVGCRRAHSISDKFDDRMIAFFALPAEDAGKKLDDAKIESDLLDDIAAAAKAVNGKLIPGRGVRRVACSAVELTPGKPASGHRVVAMFNITTDPGLVRLPDTQKKEQERLEDAIALRDARLKDLRDGKKELEEKLLPDLDKKGEALNALPKPKKGDRAKSPERVAAEKDVAAATKSIDDLARKLKIKAATKAELDRQIASVEGERATLQAQLDRWNSGALTDGELKAFEGYRYAFRTEDGWEGDGHALFPLGHHPNHFVFYQHHGSSDGAAPALTVGEFLGKRVVTGKLLKIGDRSEFARIMAWPRGQRLDAVHRQNKADERALKDLEKQQNDKLKAIKPPPKDLKEQRADLDKKQAEAKAKLTQKNAQATDEAEREYIVMSSHRKAQGTPAPAGSWIVLGCEVKTPDGALPLADDDEFEIEGDHHGKRTGREVRLHYHALAGKNPNGGLKIHAHHPAKDRKELPPGSKIMPKDVVLEHGDVLTPLRDDDVFEVEAMIGGTNIHRGHVLNVGKGDSLFATAEKPNYVHNWSTGCQVFWAFVDFNLFILLAGLSKRWRCLGASGPHECPRVKAGTDAEPDPDVWKNAKTKLHFPTDAVAKSIAADVADLQNETKAAAAEIKTKVDTWYKSQKGLHRPAKDDEAAKQMAATLDQRIAELSARLDAEKAANAKADAEGKAQTEAEKAARAKADAEWQKADGERQALVKERGDLGAAMEKRDALDAQVKNLGAVRDEISVSGEMSYAEGEEKLTAVQKKLDAEAPALTAFPKSKKAAEDASKAITTMLTSMKAVCHERAVKLRHDWTRTCDLAWGCKQRFSYTLVELAGSDATGKLHCLDKLDADFARKVGKEDAYPLWSGFKA